VGIRLWSGQKKISTTKTHTRVTVVEDEPFSLIAVEDHDDTRKLGKVFAIDHILSIEKVEHFSKCINCTRKLVQVTLDNIVQCDHCGHSMQLSQS